LIVNSEIFINKENFLVLLAYILGYTNWLYSISTGSSSAEEMVTLLVQAGLFDTAISLCQTFKLSLTPVFEGLAFKYVKKLPFNSLNFLMQRYPVA
jgi:hypothetical protein